MAIETAPDEWKNRKEEKEETIDAGVGSTYVRWGHATCPDTAQLVYEGNCMLL